MLTTRQRYSKEYYQRRKNDPHFREVKNKASLAYTRRHAEMNRIRSKTYYQENKHRYNNTRSSRRQHYRDLLFEALGGAKCVRCGFSDRRALQFDHINGDGTKKIHHDESKDSHTYVIYANDPELARKTFQVLCANCNAIKRSERYKSPLRNIVS